MEIFVNSRFIFVESIFLMAFLGTLAGTYIHDIYMWIGKIIGVFTPRKLKQKEKDREELNKSIDETTTTLASQGEEEIKETAVTPEDIKAESPENPSGVSEHTRISAEKKEKLINLLALIRTRLARNEMMESRALIIEGLSIDKHHRELNILLASLYEKDGDYAKAEIIYKEYAKHHGDDEEILSRLSKVLIVLRKYPIAYEIEKKIISLNPSSEEHLFSATGLAWEVGNKEEALEFAKIYLKQFPKNPDILWIKGQAEIELGMRKEAIEDLLKLKHLTPYNAELGELVQKLMMEEEMAENFGK